MLKTDFLCVSNKYENNVNDIVFVTIVKSSINSFHKWFGSVICFTLMYSSNFQRTKLNHFKKQFNLN